MNYLHIPKTAGTLFKNCQKLNIDLPFSIIENHEAATIERNHNVCFALRDPWTRFASGYWERVTNKQRENLNNDEANKKFRRRGYLNLSRFEKKIFTLYPTPNDLVTGFRTDALLYHKLQDERDLNVLFRSLTFWLGDFEKYVNHYSRKVVCVYDLEHLTEIFKTKYNIELPTDPFLARSRKQFELEQSYDISPDNLEWFMQWREQDYQLIEYIRKQDYFITLETL